jgi:hypothetical protein
MGVITKIWAKIARKIPSTLHSLKEHLLFGQIAKFGCEILFSEVNKLWAWQVGNFCIPLHGAFGKNCITFPCMVYYIHRKYLQIISQLKHFPAVSNMIAKKVYRQSPELREWNYEKNFKYTHTYAHVNRLIQSLREFKLSFLDIFMNITNQSFCQEFIYINDGRQTWRHAVLVDLMRICHPMIWNSMSISLCPCTASTPAL